MELTRQNIDTQLSELKYILKPLRYINPTNYAQEKRRFFRYFHKGQVYHPQFRYAHFPDTEKQKAERVLNGITIPSQTNDPLLRLYRYERKDLSLRLALLTAIGSPEILLCSRRLYGAPQKATLRYAKQHVMALPDLYQSSSTNTSSLSPQEAIVKVRAAITERGWHDWDVQQNAPGSPTVVYPEAKQLFLRRQGSYDQARIDALIMHEIEGHAVQNMNAAVQPYRILESGVGRYETLSEGYAIYIESSINPHVVSRASVNYLAVNQALISGFYETFCFLTQWLSHDDAFFLATRVKRGLCDTSQPGAFTKDLVYLEGYRLMESYTSEKRELVKQAKFDARLIDIVRGVLYNTRPASEHLQQSILT